MATAQRPPVKTSEREEVREGKGEGGEEEG